ncbi:MAG: CAP domain-containing protein [Singulisphaera sp.]|nr:CAP domain-containing protein [Singulisphaera sp.]
MQTRDFRRMMSRIELLSIVAFGLASGLGGQIAIGQSPDPELVDLIQAHNRERAARALPPLAFNAKLEEAARVQARDMAEHVKLSHEGSDGSTPSQRIERQGYHFLRVGENVAEGPKTVEEVMRIWMNSPHHRENILGDFTEIGAAVATSKDGNPYWCVDFGTPLPVLDPDRASAELVRALNLERAKHSLPAFVVDARLEAAARRHARSMAAQGAFRQKDDDGLGPLERVEKEGYRFERLGVAVASGQPSPQEVVTTWLKDPSNREDLLGPSREVGVGYAATEKGIPFWCAIFGQPAR